MASLPKTAGGKEFQRFRDALALKESSGNPSAIQWDTKARGLFQFIPRWHADWIKEETGRDLDSYMPKDSSPAEMKRAKEDQTNVLFPKYYEREISPFIQRMRKSGAGKNYTDAELGAMAHFAGAKGAETFVKTGKDSTLGTVGNAGGGIREYINQFDKHYNEADPSATLDKAAEGAKHYGEYGLGRGVYEGYKDLDLSYVRGGSKEQRQAVRAVYKGSAAPVFTAEQKAGKSQGEPTTSYAQTGHPQGFSNPDMMGSENSSVLSQMVQLNARLAGASPLVNEMEFFNRIRAEGRGA